MKEGVRDRVAATAERFQTQLESFDQSHAKVGARHRGAGILAGYTDADDPPWPGEWDNSAR